MCKGVSSAGPLRLMMCTSSWCCAAPCKRRRSGAADDSCAACIGRKANTRRGLPLAWLLLAKCKRRSCSERAWGNHTSRAATSLHRSTCSAAHRRCAGWLDSTKMMLPLGTPMRDRAAKLGKCGLPTNTMLPSWLHARRAGNSRRHSCEPAWVCKISVSAPVGQPALGNWASNRAKPEPTVGCCDSANALARHTVSRCANVPRAGLGWVRAGDGIALYDNCLFIQYYQIFCNPRRTLVAFKGA